MKKIIIDERWFRRIERTVGCGFVLIMFVAFWILVLELVRWLFV